MDISSGNLPYAPCFLNIDLQNWDIKMGEMAQYHRLSMVRTLGSWNLFKSAYMNSAFLGPTRRHNIPRLGPGPPAKSGPTEEQRTPESPGGWRILPRGGKPLDPCDYRNPPDSHWESNMACWKIDHWSVIFLLKLIGTFPLLCLITRG